MCAVEDVLHHFREQFIKDMDANAVLHELQWEGFISDNVKSEVKAATSSKERNEILYDHLSRTSTTESLITTCDIISQVKGNPRMRALGEQMKNELEIGKCVYVRVTVSEPCGATNLCSISKHFYKVIDFVEEVLSCLHTNEKFLSS